MTEWTKEICSSRPPELQEIAPGLLMQRKDIKEVEHEATEDGAIAAYTDWECLCREITVSEFALLGSIQEIDNSKAIDAYTMQLIEEGVL